jgi:hypothetical protein
MEWVRSGHAVLCCHGERQGVVRRPRELMHREMMDLNREEEEEKKTRLCRIDARG